MIIRDLIVLAFRADGIQKLKDLNLELQGGYRYVADMIAAINAFRSKLLFWKSRLYKNCLYVSKCGRYC
jgi:hypothetical protein